MNGKGRKDRMEKLPTFNSGFFTYLQKFFLSDAGFQNKSFYQPTSSMLQSKKRIKPLIVLLVGNQKGYYIVLFFLCKILFSNIA